MSITISLGLLAALAGPAAAFWRLPCKSPLVVQRADPIVNPGAVSGHVHQILGGSAFDFEMTYEDTQNSECTTCTVKKDFSNYWTPNLYYQDQNGSFTSVEQVGGGTIYYLQRSGPKKDKLLAFPEGFRMLAGDPSKRSAGNDFASQAISYNCLNYEQGNPETPGFPKQNCPNGLRAQVFFPSCWDGVNLDSANHKDHMAYPIGAYNDGACPDSHPVHLVSLFYEITFNTNAFKDMWHGEEQPFVWAQGDATGYGFHGDFLMGWDRDVLQKAVDECTNDSGRVEDCHVFQFYDDAIAEGCRIAPKIDEQVLGTLDRLPGCNPVTTSSGSGTTKPTCDHGSDAVIGAPKSMFKDLTNNGWAYQGCGKDDYYNRALKGASTTGQNMTNDECIQFCDSKGFSLAGSEYANQCYCDNSLPTPAAPLPGVVGACNMECAGDSTDFCGGAGAMTLYKKCSGSSCTNAAGTTPGKPGNGGAQSPSPPSQGNGANNGNGSGSDNGAGQTGSPGNNNPGNGAGSATGPRPSNSASSLRTSSVSIATASSVSQQTRVQSSRPTISTSVANNPIQEPSPTGGKPSNSRSSVQNQPTGTSNPSSTVPSSTPTNVSSGLSPGWSYQGCAQDTREKRVLPRLAPYTIGQKLVTASTCVSWCQEAGYAAAGTEYGGECFCGSTEDAQNIQKIADSECSLACKGDSSEICGGPDALSWYMSGSNGIGAGGSDSKNGTAVNTSQGNVKWSSWAKRNEDGTAYVKAKAHMRKHARGRFARGAF